MPTENIREYRRICIFAPYMMQIRKIVSVPGKVIYVNLAAAPTANIIRLVQGEEELLQK